MILSTAPWRRAPALVLRAPAVVVAVALSAAVLALAAASGPLFVSATGSAALSRQAAEVCPEALLPALHYSGYGGRLLDRPGLDRTQTTIAAAVAAAGLPAPERVLLADVPLDGQQQGLTLFSRAGAEDRVRVTARVPGTGILLSDLAARRLQLELGDTVRSSGLPVRIVGLYTDLNGPAFGTDVPRYWCTWKRQILVTLEQRPPPLALTDPDTLLRLARPVAPTPGPTDPPLDAVGATWYSPAAVDAATLGRADEILAAQGRLPGALDRLDGGLALGTGVEGDLPGAIGVSALQRDGVAGAVRPISVAGSVVALLLVAGAGAYWAERRRREVVLLAARGAGPGPLAVKAVLELALPALAGSVLGWFAALALVGALGPAPRIEPSARVEAAVAVGAGLVLGLVLLGVAAVARQRAAERRRTGRLSRVPWELLLLGAALATFLQVRDGTGIVVRARSVSVSPLLLAYPLLALAGLLLLAARLAGMLSGPALRRTARLPVPAYLAARRLAGGGLVTLALGALVAVPAGLLVYGGVVTRSTETSTAAKAAVYTGGQVVVVTRARPGATPDAGGSGSVVSAATGLARIRGGPDLEVGVLGVTRDVDRFADTRGIGSPVREVLDQLGGDRAVVVGCERCDITAIRLRGTTLPVRVVDRRDVFPGMRRLSRPTVVVDRAALAGADPYAERVEEVWTTEADLPAVEAALRAAGVPADRQRRPDQFLDVTDLVPITWTFGYLQALAALTGLVAVAGLLLHLGARQRAATVSYPMQRRMGLGRGRHLRSLTVELGVLLGAGTAAGAALGLAVAWSVHGLLDVNQDFPPPPGFALPAALLGALAAAALLLVAVAALATQRTADRISPADALRVGG